MSYYATNIWNNFIKQIKLVKCVYIISKITNNMPFGVLLFLNKVVYLINWMEVRSSFVFFFVLLCLCFILRTVWLWKGADTEDWCLCSEFFVDLWNESWCRSYVWIGWIKTAARTEVLSSRNYCYKWMCEITLCC